MKMFINYDKIVKWARNNPVIVLISILIVISSSLLTLTTNTNMIYNKCKMIFFPYSLEYEKIKKLGAGTTIEHFHSILGAPQFRNVNGKMREYIYVHKCYYVQAITDQDDTVQGYSITTREEKFNPVFDLNDMTGSSINFRVVLGKTKFKFSDLPDRPASVYSNYGAWRQWYNEAYYFGNPGLYQTYIAAYNIAGVRMPEHVYRPNDIAINILKQSDWDAVESKLREFRACCPINTFFVGKPLGDAGHSCCGFDIGVDYDTVTAFYEKGVV